MKSLALSSLLVVAVLAGCKRDCPTCPPAQAQAAQPTPDHATTDHATPPPATTAALPASPDHLPPNVNAVQNEMRLLHEAMRETVSALALGTLTTVPERLHVVHRARALTEHALETGSYTLPKNPSQLPAFKALDESFHGELEKLVEAASANDPVKTATALGNVMGRCEGCHTQFRAPTQK
ncbi:MAG TPA: cytochrome c [Kofleriaceae bacterium]